MKMALHVQKKSKDAGCDKFSLTYQTAFLILSSQKANTHRRLIEEPKNKDLSGGKCRTFLSAKEVKLPLNRLSMDQGGLL